MQVAGSLASPALIGAVWLALAVASLVQLDEMGRTVAQARAAEEAKKRPVQTTVPIAATCQNATVSTTKAN
jgi:hypothetical protein